MDSVKVTLEPLGAVLDVQRGERILDAARRQGFECPQSCRNGNCHICVAQLLAGKVKQGGAELDHGELTACMAEPVQDCTLHWDGVLAPGVLPVRRLSCQLIECSAQGSEVFRLRLRAPAGKLPRYHAGQYLLIEREEGEPVAFSIASAPHYGRELELHILAREPAPQQLLAQLQQSGRARVQLPLGDAHLSELPDGPLLLIAAGTGMAQMHSLIEHCIEQGFAHPLYLYWGVRQAQDFYRVERWPAWQGFSALRIEQIVSDDPHWPGRHGLLHQAINADFPDLSELTVYASGSPNMVYATLDALVAAGMSPHQMRADVFAYAPRE